MSRRHARRKEAKSILAELVQIRKTQYVDAYFMAVLMDVLVILTRLFRNWNARTMKNRRCCLLWE